MDLFIFVMSIYIEQSELSVNLSGKGEDVSDPLGSRGAAFNTKANYLTFP